MRLIVLLSTLACELGCAAGPAQGPRPTAVVGEQSAPTRPEPSQVVAHPPQQAPTVELPPIASVDPVRAEAAMRDADAAYEADDAEGFARSLEVAAGFGDARANYNLGVLAQQRGAWLLAEARFRRALALRSDYPQARLELARMFAEGWGRPVDHAQAARRFRELVSTGDETIRGLAHVNLGIFAFYGMGVPHSLSEARAHLQEAKALGVVEADSLLAGIPPQWESWPGAQPEPEWGDHTLGFDASPGGYYSRPRWAPDDADWRSTRIAVPMAGSYVADQVIALGVPGSDVPPGPPGSAKRTACFEWKARSSATTYLDYRTWHTNSETCSHGMFVVASRGDEVTLLQNDTMLVTDVRTGARSTVSGCYVRARLAEASVEFLEDWPRMCSRRQCSGRGQLVGRRIELRHVEQSCDDIESSEDAKTIALATSTPPEWAVVDEARGARALRRHEGVWSHRHRMPMFEGEDPETGEAIWQETPVTDVLRICHEGDVGWRFHLDNWTVNGHGCFVEGVPGVNASGDLLLVTDPVNYLSQGAGLGPDGLACTLRVGRRGGKLVVEEVWPASCFFSECGARAHPTDAALAVRSRSKRGCSKPYVNPLE